MASQGAGFINMTVEINSGDLRRIESRLAGSKGRITTGLHERIAAMGALGAAALNAGAPHGQGGDWARGEPPLEESHFWKYLNITEGYLYTTAEHAKFIVEGFTPHMPPAEAWLGDENDGYMARKAVLENQTPTNPVDYWTPVEEMLAAENQHWAEIVGAMWLGS